MTTENKIFLTAQDLSERLGISVARAYKMIRRMNAELEKQGYLVIAGKIPTRYFEKRWYYAFEMLYWCGIREGELLALTPADFDFASETVRINKSYQRLNGQDIITTPKTPKSNRMAPPRHLTEKYFDNMKCVIVKRYLR